MALAEGEWEGRRAPKAIQVVTPTLANPARACRISPNMEPDTGRNACRATSIMEFGGCDAERRLSAGHWRDGRAPRKTAVGQNSPIERCFRRPLS